MPRGQTTREWAGEYVGKYARFMEHSDLGYTVKYQGHTYASDDTGELADRVAEAAEQWQRQCYGMTEDALRKDVENALSEPSMYAMQILSDAQEVLAIRDGGSATRAETVRQFINKAKFIIGTMLTETPETVDMRRGV